MTGTDWSPSFSYLGTGHTTATGWGQTLNESGIRATHDVTATLCDARLTIEDIEFVTSLRLDPEWHTPEECTRFVELVGALPRIMNHPPLSSPQDVSRFRPEPGKLWIQELVAGFIPPRLAESDELVHDQTEYFVEYDYAAPLAILHILMMRSRFWLDQFIARSGMDRQGLRDYWDIQGDEEVLPYIYKLAGDPLNLPPRLPDGTWDPETFSRRMQVFLDYIPISMRPFMTDLDLLARITASLYPELQGYIMAYDRWCQER